MRDLFKDTLIGQIRALDQFGTWANKSDEELLEEKYIKTKEQLKEIPIIADIDEMIIQDIRLIFQAIALAFEKKTTIMCAVVMEMSHEGFGKVVVIADDIVIATKSFKDAHRFSYRSIDKLLDDGEKYLTKAIEKYNSYKNN
jgi:probable nitrogen fixation protein